MVDCLRCFPSRAAADTKPLYKRQTYLRASMNRRKTLALAIPKLKQLKMNTLLTIVWLGCLFTITCAYEGKKIEVLVEENTKELEETRKLLGHIDETNGKIISQLEQQRVWLAAITRVDELLGKINQFIDVQSVVVLEALNNVTLKSGKNSERLHKDLESLNRIQLSTKQQISGLENKLEVYQKYLLQSAHSIDNNILALTKLVTRAVLPQLNGLKCSFDSLETSQINIEVELKSLPRIKEINDDSNSKLYALGEQLGSLNRTQEARLSVLISAINKLNPINAWQIENALRELIISQKRIELDLQACEKQPTPQNPLPASHAAYPQSYDLNPHAAQSYEGNPPALQARASYQGKQVHHSQVSSVKKPHQPGMLRAQYSFKN